MRANGLYLADLAFKTGQRAVKVPAAQRPVLPAWLGGSSLPIAIPSYHRGKVARHQLLPSLVGTLMQRVAHKKNPGFMALMAIIHTIAEGVSVTGEPLLR